MASEMSSEVIHTTSRSEKSRLCVMVNLMGQLDQATGPRYVIKHYSGCFCKGTFG